MKKCVLSVSFMFIACFFAQPITADAATLVRPANNLGLVGYWSFDQGSGTVATDFSGNGNTGTLTNMAAPATATSGWGNGKLGGGLNFDGTNDYITAGTGSTLSFESNSKFTISAWVNVSTNLSTNGVIASKRTDSPATDWRGYELSVDGSTGKLFFAGMYVCCGGTTYMLLNGSTNLKDGKWHHVVLTFDGQAGGTYAANVSLYVDGVAETKTVSSDNLKNGSILNSAPFMIGAKAGGAVTPFSGKIDEVRVYNRVLSSTQVISLYNTGAQKLKVGASNNGLVGYWSFDDGTSTKALDFSGNGNTGTLTNSPTWVNGKMGQALNFNGVNQNVVVGDANSLDVTSTYSMSFWFKPSDLTQTNTYLVGKLNNSSTDNVWAIVWEYVNNKVQFYCGYGCAAGYPSSNTDITISDTGWHHIIYTYDGVSLKGYLDGLSAITPVAGSYPLTASTGQLVIADFTNAVGQNFNGRIDEVRIYNRALSTAEITGLYTSGAQKINASRNITGSSLDSGLVGLWSFNGPDVNATTVFDRSGNGNNGTRTNGTTLAQGKVGQGLSFDGVDDYVDIPDSNALDLAGDFTLSFFIKPGTSNSLYDGVLDKMPGNAGWAVLYSSANILNLWINNSNVLQTTSVINSNTWSHVTFVKTSTQTQVFVNGVLNATGTTANPTATANSLYIGRYTSSANASAGSVDDVRIYNRALSASEVQLLYNLGK